MLPIISLRVAERHRAAALETEVANEGARGRHYQCYGWKLAAALLLHQRCISMTKISDVNDDAELTQK